MGWLVLVLVVPSSVIAAEAVDAVVEVLLTVRRKAYRVDERETETNLDKEEGCFWPNRK